MRRTLSLRHLKVLMALDNGPQTTPTIRAALEASGESVTAENMANLLQPLRDRAFVVMSKRGKGGTGPNGASEWCLTDIGRGVLKREQEQLN